MKIEPATIHKLSPHCSTCSAGHFSPLCEDRTGKMRHLDAVIDRINRTSGTETIVLGSQQYTQKDGKGKADAFANAIRHDIRSKNPTTRWSDRIVLK